MGKAEDDFIAGIFKVKGSDPEQFAIAYSDPSVKTRGYAGEMKFMTPEQVREFLKTFKSEAQIDYILEQARQRAR